MHCFNSQGSEKASDGATSSKKAKSASNGTAAVDADKKKKEKKPQGVQNDPTKSEVYKSLFDTHKSAINKPKGNWVTFDPRYN